MSTSKPNSYLGLITARGGSKRLPNKNIKELDGKPLILYTVDAALKSKMFERIVLTTDSPEIIDVVKKHTKKVEIPFVRDKKLAQDSTPHLPVVIDALDRLYPKAREKKDDVSMPTATMILQPTSPFRTAKHIKESCALLDATVDSVLGVCRIDEGNHPERMFYQDSQGRLKTVTGRPVMKRITRSQDYSEAYKANAAIYLFHNDLLFGENPTFYGERVVPYVMDEKSSIDIDTAEDFIKAEIHL